MLGKYFQLTHSEILDHQISIKRHTRLYLTANSIYIVSNQMPKKTYNGPSNQSRSSVTLGNEDQYGGSSTWQPNSRASFAPETVKGAEPYHKREVNGNASKVAFGRVGATPRNYASQNAEEFAENTSVHNPTYKRAAPAPGFDRQTANKTNYELGDTETIYETAVAQSTQNPKELPSPGGPEFPKLILRDYNPHNCAGYKHNVVTGINDPYAKDRPLPKRFESNDKDLYGDVTLCSTDQYYDSTVQRMRTKPKAPPAVLAQVVESPLDSCLALRPPLQNDTKLHPYRGSIRATQ